MTGFETSGSTGLKRTDPRLKEMLAKIKAIHTANKLSGSPEALTLDKDSFKSIIRENIVLISRALRHHFVIPDFQEFTKYLEDFYWKCKVIVVLELIIYITKNTDFNFLLLSLQVNRGGKVADYIAQVAKV